ncbi:MAG: hypothetical protein QXU09_01610 [Thermoproteota archaeon]
MTCLASFQNKIIIMKRVKASEIVDYWGKDLYQVSDRVMEMFKEHLEEGNINAKEIRRTEDLRDILTDYILHELEFDLYDAFPEDAFYAFGYGMTFIVETNDGDIKVDEENYEKVIPDLIERELAKRYSEENGLLALAKDLAMSTIDYYEDEIKKLFKVIKYQRTAIQEAEKVLKSLKEGNISVLDIEDFESLLREHLANHLKEKFPKTARRKLPLIDHVATKVAKSFTEENKTEIKEAILSTLKKQTIENMHRISL